MDKVCDPEFKTTALKEWAVAVQALAAGETILLLRKGGIREQRFVQPSAQPQFWLYPTYEHQKPHLLKAPYANQVTPVEPGWHPETVELRAWAKITDGFEVQSESELEALLPHHIWNATFVTERLTWKPSLPLTALLLRVYRLPQPRVIPYYESYGGCKSWIDMPIAIELSPNPATPALADAVYAERRQAILRHHLTTIQH